MAHKVDEETWVRLLGAFDQVQARLVAAHLRNLNVPVLFQDESLSQTPPATLGLIANYILFVPEGYYDYAQGVLKAMDALEEDEDGLDDA